MKNYEILSINQTLGGLLNEKIRGKLKFKLFKNKREVEEATKLVVEALEGVSDEDERSEILDQEQKLILDNFTYDELEPLALSIRDLVALEPILEEE